MKSKTDYKSLILNLNLPENWLTKLNKIAEDKGQNLEQLVIELLGKTLAEHDDDQPKPLQKAVEKKETPAVVDNSKIEDIDDRLKQLETKQAVIDKLEERVVLLEKLMDSVQRQVIVRDYAGKLPAHLIDDSDHIDDEPDEILTDFLD